LGYKPGVRGTAEGMRDWMAEFRPRAETAGLSAEVLDSALPGVEFLPDVVEKDRRQDEFTRAIWDYMDRAVSDDRIALGRKAMKKHAALLAKVEATFGVDPAYVVAIWGLESSFGAGRGDIPTLSALATLAYDGRRGAYFEQELLQALRLLQSGDATLADLRGSWAGATGHTQFMPTSFWNIAVDFDGDGRRNLWADDPTDALASTAAYLKNSGWKTGEPWGFEITLPEGFDWELAGDRTQKPMSFWAAKGITRAHGGALPESRWASLLLPAGHRGPALMIFDNFGAVETYNLADAYVIAVCHLADRLRGGPEFSHEWPRDLRVLTLAERMELQQKLTVAGFSTAGVDGRIGPRTLNAIKGFQRAQDLPADGFASTELLEMLRASQAENVRP
jgi:membrane-bound lytic murein transglycosylase B